MDIEITHAVLATIVREAHEHVVRKYIEVHGMTPKVITLGNWWRFTDRIQRQLASPEYAASALAKMRAGTAANGQPIYNNDLLKCVWKCRPGEPPRAVVSLGNIGVEVPLYLSNVDDDASSTGRMSYAGNVALKPRTMVTADPGPPEGKHAAIMEFAPDGKVTVVEVLIDGLTRAQCLARFVHLQRWGEANCVFSGTYRETMGLGPTDCQSLITLTPAQLVVAREEWSAALRVKRAEEVTRARANAVVCDDDRWEA